MPAKQSQLALQFLQTLKLEDNVDAATRLCCQLFEMLLCRILPEAVVYSHQYQDACKCNRETNDHVDNEQTGGGHMVTSVWR